jgi:Alginate export
MSRTLAGAAALALALVVGPPAAHAQPAAPAPAAPAPAAPDPWRIDRALGAPSWLELGIEHRSRFEHLWNDFRANATGDGDALSLRTLLAAKARSGWFSGGLELEDARVYASDSTPLNTTLADPLDLLQAYAGIRAADVFTGGDQLDVRAGRITIDLSTRRLVARNHFRNTINGFTGVDASWTSPGKRVARAFVAVPVTRLPSDADKLADNQLALDEEDTDALLWAVYYGSPISFAGTQLELYVVGFHERDGTIASRNRQLLTFGAHWFRKPAAGTVDFDLELLPQVGTSRATTAADDTTDLDDRAWSSHVEVGFGPAIAWKPRLSLQHDYASGDRDPDDRTMQRFDPLFGARRFDFGPTGIYGPFARGNIQSPGIRFSIDPSSRVSAFARYRLFWLASATDTWVKAGPRDPSGSSGTFLGQQVEVSVRWRPLPKNLTLEAGAAYLRRGQFATSAPGTRTDDAGYLYTQVTVEL